MKEMGNLELELNLLNYWKSKDVKWLYKYKNRVKEYRGENLVSIELFNDLTSGSIFTDITDIANFGDVTGDDVKIDIEDLIANRQHANM